jgi:hypothetical protein
VPVVDADDLLVIHINLPSLIASWWYP